MFNAQSGIYTPVGIVDTYINFWVRRYFDAYPRVSGSDFVIGFAAFREAVSKQALNLH